MKEKEEEEEDTSTKTRVNELNNELCISRGAYS